MRYKIEIKETISRYNTYVIEVESEEDGDIIAADIEGILGACDHPDDIAEIFRNEDCKLVDIEEGEENFKCEMY